MIYDTAESLSFRRNQLLLDKLLVKLNTPAQGCKFTTTNLGHIWLFLSKSFGNEKLSITAALKCWVLENMVFEECWNLYRYIYIYIMFWYVLMQLFFKCWWLCRHHWVSLLLGGVFFSCREASRGVQLPIPTSRTATDLSWVPVFWKLFVRFDPNKQLIKWFFLDLQQCGQTMSNPAAKRFTRPSSLADV